MVVVNTTNPGEPHTRLLDALAATNSSTRLRAALSAGTLGNPGLAQALLARCAVEPDFFVRDMLTWALCRLPPEITVPRLLEELFSTTPQARSQALHTLSKIGDRTAWPAVSALLHDAHDEVALSAWRAAVVLVPSGAEGELAANLVKALGRGDHDMQCSMSRALATLGPDASPALDAAGASRDPRVRAHAAATERLLDDPESGFTLSVEAAKRVAVTGTEM
ncbi:MULTISPECIES: HEAT repeat domain-containing protein [unclassified Rhodococcus (in: high G+C Gram-positive bacteria)]|uniref:HEAT repeat domain-containing protein n=1 Tax=unclassified Rhodococcus (in: high G+C Gram-positive bacteria) TaxID=192944 RepID=UPI0015C41963|nr:HEAT repeat domain-containing protein [Rhodococcus sp. 1163]